MPMERFGVIKTFSLFKATSTERYFLKAIISIEKVQRRKEVN